MDLFKSRPNRRVRLAMDGVVEDGTMSEGTTVVEESEFIFTEKEFKAMQDAVMPKAEGLISPGELINAVVKMAEEYGKLKEEKSGKVKASQRRLVAEQVIDQAIRLGKANPADRERWIKVYDADPTGTVRKLNGFREVPLIEMGHSNVVGVFDPADKDFNPGGVEEETPKPSGWVR